MGKYTIDVFGIPVCLPPDKIIAVEFLAIVPALLPVVTKDGVAWDLLVDRDGTEWEIICKGSAWDDEESKGFYAARAILRARYAQMECETPQNIPAEVLEHPSWATPIMEGLLDELMWCAVDPDERRAKENREMRREKRRD